MHITAVDMWYQSRGNSGFVTTQVAIQDSASGPVSGAAVTITLTKPDGSDVVDTGVTGDDGTVTFKLRSGLSGEYMSTVTAVSKDGWEYNPDSNAETGDTLIVP
jgi:hypothetical protein